MVRADRRLMVRMIAEELSINKDTVWHIITENLEMCKVCAKMVLKLLSEDQKQQRETVCHLFKFQFNQMKIEDFRNTTLVVDLWPVLTFWSMLTSKIIGWLNSVNDVGFSTAGAAPRPHQTYTNEEDACVTSLSKSCSAQAALREGTRTRGCC